MTDAQLWALIVGFLAAPNVIAIINQPSWSKGARTTVMVSTSIVVGAGTAFFAHQFTGRSVLSSVLVAAVAAITAYKGFYKPTNIAPALERATSPKSSVCSLT
jgi:amino acid permease